MTANEARIRKVVRDQILYILRSDLEGGKSIMKEAWEECANDALCEVSR